jgi:hypothetical protein
MNRKSKHKRKTKRNRKVKRYSGRKIKTNDLSRPETIAYIHQPLTVTMKQIESPLPIIPFSPPRTSFTIPPKTLIPYYPIDQIRRFGFTPIRSDTYLPLRQAYYNHDYNINQASSLLKQLEQ